MSKRARLGLDLAALAVLLLGLLVGLAVFSYDPADPPGTSIHPVHVIPSNLLGAVGSLVSHALFAMFGFAAYSILGVWFILFLTLLLEGRRGVWCWRLLGWSLLVPGVAMLAECLGLSLGRLPAGPGGQLGNSLRTALEVELTKVGVYLVTAVTLF